MKIINENGEQTTYAPADKRRRIHEDLVYNPYVSEVGPNIPTFEVKDPIRNLKDAVTNNKDVPVLRCPNCCSTDHHSFGVDESEIRRDGTGYEVEYKICNNCGEHIRIHTDFKYEITKQYIEK